MTRPALSTIGQLLYPAEQAYDLAQIVAEIEDLLARLRVGGKAAEPLEVHWDQDDLVYFDVLETRILLASVECGRGAMTTCLTLSVGPSGRQSRQASHHAVLCSRLVEQIRSRFPPTAILWQEVAGPVNADVIDDLFDTLPKLAPAAPPARPENSGKLHRGALLPPLAAPESQPRKGGSADQSAQHHGAKPTFLPGPPGSGLSQSPVLRALTRLRPAPRTRVRPATEAMPTAQPKAVARDIPNLPPQRDDALIRLRAAIYSPDPVASDVPSTQIRLAAHCFNATLILVWMPLGAAMMTYSILKGEDIRLSSRLIAVVGAVVMLAHSPYGSAVKAIAGV